MKKQLNKFLSNGIYTTLISVPLFFAVPSLATTTNDTTAKAQVKYAGKENKYLIFDVSYTNSEHKKVLVELFNKDTNEVLFKKEYKDSTISNKIYLLAEDVDCTLTFRVKSGKTVYKQSFNISNQTTYVDDLMVTKL